MTALIVLARVPSLISRARFAMTAPAWDETVADRARVEIAVVDSSADEASIAVEARWARVETSERSGVAGAMESARRAMRRSHDRLSVALRRVCVALGCCSMSRASEFAAVITAASSLLGSSMIDSKAEALRAGVIGGGRRWPWPSSSTD
jgi:hypothetical protein